MVIHCIFLSILLYAYNFYNKMLENKEVRSRHISSKLEQTLEQQYIDLCSLVTAMLLTTSSSL